MGKWRWKDFAFGAEAGTRLYGWRVIAKGGRGCSGVADSDGDGLLGLEDLVCLMEGGEEEEKVKGLRDAFQVYDVEGCGFITPKSLKRMLSSLGESRSIDECKVMINQFDLNGDGISS
ncbi:calmodulin-like 38 [Prunus dulcis]|uniref:Calmodulin-like 38 n=1 Tax=Prunus dulcis TaxID=3755 RepID=A0A4Y1RHD2_PRUDU|nr:calmodulin-like 38 [Prunus dulcis]